MTRIDDDLNPSTKLPSHADAPHEVPEVEEQEPLTVRSNKVDQVRREMGVGGAMQVLDAPTDDVRGAASESDEYPAAPKDGFAGLEDFQPFVATMNKKAVKDFAEYSAHPEKYRRRDPENPDKYLATVIHTCADGRCNPAGYAEKELDHLNINWLPAAGLNIFPEVQVPHSMEDLENDINDNKALREKLFERLDMLYGESVETFLKEHQAGIASKMAIEFQAHFDQKHPGHGCGAHKSKLEAAQKETIKDCVIAEQWFRDRYPEQFNKGLFRIFRSIQDTSEKGDVYSGAFIDKMLTSSQKDGFEKLFTQAQSKYTPPLSTSKKEGVVREFKGNPYEIDTDHHSEQGIRVSNLHFASTLKGQSVMEICWNDPENLLTHIKVLLDIIGDNKFTNQNPDKPHIIHLDMVKGDKKIALIYQELINLLHNDPKLKERFEKGLRNEKGGLKLMTTQTDRANMEMEKAGS